MTTPRLELLFPTPIVIAQVERHKEYKEKFVPLLTQMKLEAPNQAAPWAKLEHTWTSFSNDTGLTVWDEQFQKLVHDFLNYLQGYPIEFEIEIDGWFNVHDSTMYIEQHEHFPSIISGIYYLQLDDTNAYPATFVNPFTKDLDRCNAKGIEFEAKCDALKSHTFPNSLDIKEGDVVLFPSYLSHLVRRSRSVHDNLRISYAFNVENKTSYNN